MYEDLIARLRKMSKISAGLSVLLPKAGGNAMAELLEEAADALEKEGNLTADVRPVVRGRWEDKRLGPWGMVYATCAACKERVTLERRHRNFCPNCGADARKDKT